MTYEQLEYIFKKSIGHFTDFAFKKVLHCPDYLRCVHF